jgi:hypothetical protein
LQHVTAESDLPGFRTDALPASLGFARKNASGERREEKKP